MSLFIVCVICFQLGSPHQTASQTRLPNNSEVGLQLFERLQKHNPFIKMELCTLSYQISQSSRRKCHHCALVPMCPNLIYEIGVRFGKYFRFSFLNSECIICPGQWMHHFLTSWGSPHTSLDLCWLEIIFIKLLFSVKVECTPSDMLVTLSFGQVSFPKKHKYFISILFGVSCIYREMQYQFSILAQIFLHRNPCHSPMPPPLK